LAGDPDGREVVLDDDAWQHITTRHPLSSSWPSVLAAIANPDHRELDPRPGRERYWRRGFGPGPWLVVVVDFDEHPARIVAASGRRTDPPGW
jgi:hypothetical protein